MKSEYWWYKAYLLQLKQHNKELAEGMDKLWDRKDVPLEARNKRLRTILEIIQNE